MLVLLLLGATAATILTPRQAQAIAAPDDHSVLILDDTITGGAGSFEATKAAGLGFTVVIATSAQWAATTTGEFASYRALILGDPTCLESPTPIAAAEANKAVWGAAVNGNVIVIGTDPTYHSTYGPYVGPQQLIESGIAFAGADAAKTGAYVCLSCYYHSAASGTPVPVLDPFGTFTVVGQGACPANSHIIATHPALSGLTDALLSNWSCSAHEGMVSWPATFDPLVISLDIPSSFVAGDGTSGAPYILARGATILSHICLTPGEATNPLDTDHTVTAFVNSQLDCAGAPVADKLVTFLVIDGPNNGVGGAATTGADGKCTFTYHGVTAGTDVIQASFHNETGAVEYTRAVKHWGGECAGGRIECPENITVRCTGPDGAVVEFPTPKAYDCEGHELPVVCTKESGTWFHTGLTRIECFGPDDPSGDCLYCSFDVEVEPTNCPQTTSYWADHAASWPVSTLKLGCNSYSASQLLAILAYSGTDDASMILARQLAGAKLNLANCTDPCPISDVIVQADCLIDCLAIPGDVSPTGSLGLQMLALAQTLNEYNEALLTPRCSPDKALVQVDQIGVSGFQFRLNPALPNPFSGPTSLVFTLPSAADARLSVFDLQGREVKVLLKGSLPAGRHSAVWNGTDDNGVRVADGVYFARLSVGGNRTLMQRLVKVN